MYLRLAGTGAVILSLFLIGLVLLAGWELYVWFVLSTRGIVAPGALIAEETISGKSTSYRETYGFQVAGQRFNRNHTYSNRGSVRNNVWLLFESQKPNRAQVIPAILNRA